MKHVSELWQDCPRKEFGAAIGATVANVNAYGTRNFFPAKKYRVVERWCKDHSLPMVPDRFFSFDEVGVADPKENGGRPQPTPIKGTANV